MTQQFQTMVTNPGQQVEIIDLGQLAPNEEIDHSKIQQAINQMKDLGVKEKLQSQIKEMIHKEKNLMDR